MRVNSSREIPTEQSRFLCQMFLFSVDGKEEDNHTRETINEEW